jgi:pimeloyl-ACP methyl ester carboxylesterase
MNKFFKLKATMLAIATYAMLLVSCVRENEVPDLDISSLSLKVTPASLTLKVGYTGTFGTNIAPATWNSSDASVVVVNASTGEVTALELGSAIISATGVDGRKASGTVTVVAITLDSISVTPIVVPELLIGDSVQLSAIGVPDNSTIPFVADWSSDDENVAFVTETGVVYALGEGSATITVKAKDYPDEIVAKRVVTVVGEGIEPVFILDQAESTAWAEAQGYGGFWGTTSSLSNWDVLSELFPEMKMGQDGGIHKPSGVGVYKVRYITKLNDRRVMASGLIISPATITTKRPLIVYNHGTMKEHVAPSFFTKSYNSGDYPDIPKFVAFADMLQSVVLMPDYIGHGRSISEGHPYVHAESLGQAGLDMITYYNSLGGTQFPQKNNVTIIGYSEGGYASVALNKKIQEDGRYSVVKTYAGAGPYDIKNFSKELMEETTNLEANTISSFLWVIQTYKNYSGFSMSYDEIFTSDANRKLKGHDYKLGYLVKYDDTPLNPQNLFHGDFRDMVINPDAYPELLQILEDNTLTDFVPRNPLFLFHSTADKWVYPSNTERAAAKMLENGMKAEDLTVYYNESGLNHEQAAEDFVKQIVFDIVPMPTDCRPYYYLDIIYVQDICLTQYL